MSKNVFQLMRGLNPLEPDPVMMWQTLDRELRFLRPTQAEREKVHTAFSMAFEHHKDAPLRDEKRAYIFHGWRATIRQIWLQYRLGLKDIRILIAILLHDTREDAKKVGRKPEDVDAEILEKFGEESVSDVQYLGKMTEDETDDEFIIRLLSAGDWRVITARISEQTDNFETIRFRPPAKQKAKIRDTERKWQHLLFTILKTVIEREIANGTLTPPYASLPDVLERILRRAIKKEKRRLKMK